MREYPLPKTAPDGRALTTQFIKESREANKQRISGLRAQMLDATVTIANSVLKNSGKDRDVLAKIRAQIELAEDADHALALAELLAELRDIEVAQKQLASEREHRRPRAKDRTRNRRESSTITLHSAMRGRADTYATLALGGFAGL